MALNIKDIGKIIRQMVLEHFGISTAIDSKVILSTKRRMDLAYISTTTVLYTKEIG